MFAQVTRFCIVLIFILAGSAHADVLKMPGDTMPQVATSPGAPERGMSKNQVEQAYGANTAHRRQRDREQHQRAVPQRTEQAGGQHQDE